MFFVEWIIGKLLDCGIDYFKEQDIVEQLYECITNAFDKVSEKYPISEGIGKYTFWDYVNFEFREICTEANIQDTNIVSIFTTILTNIKNEKLLDNALIPENTNEICEHFMHNLNMEIANYQSLYNYILLMYISELPAKKDICGIFEQILNKDDNIDEKFIHQQINNYLSVLAKNSIEYSDDTYIFRTLSEDISFDKLLKDENNILLLGEAGSGKTFFSQRVIYDLINNKSTTEKIQIPVFIPIAPYSEKGLKDISEIIHNIMTKCIPSLSQENIQKMLVDGSFFIVIDGLDEIGDKRKYSEYIQDIIDICKYNYNNHVFVTCRDSRYNNELDHYFKKISLFPLGKEQIDDYFCKINGRIRYDLKDFHYELFSNPLFLKIGAKVISQNKGSLPLNKSILFNEFVKYSYDIWDKSNGRIVEKMLSLNETKDIFSLIAYDFFENSYIEKEDIEQEILNRFPQKSCVSILNELVNTGIIIKTENNDFMFIHKTFKEFFTAVYLSKQINLTDDCKLNQYINDKTWQDVIIFLSGEIKDSLIQDKFLDLIMNNNLKLYIACIISRNHIHDNKSMALKDNVMKYLSDLLNSYRDIVKLYFNQLSKFFMPSPIGNKNYNVDDVIICGNIFESSSLIYYFDFRNNRYKDDVNLISENEIQSADRYFASQRRNYSINWVNLDLMNVSGKNARFMTLKIIKEKLDDIFKNYKLHESAYLISDRIKNIVSKNSCLRRVDNIRSIEEWIDNIISKELEANNSIVEIQHEGTKLFNLKSLLNQLKDMHVQYHNCLLPERDINLPGGYVTEFYSEDRFSELIKKFLYFKQSSFKEMIESNFYALKNQLPDYENLPFQYCAYIECKEIPYARKEFIVTSFYISTKDNEILMPIVYFRKPPTWEDISQEIKQSYIENKKDSIYGSISRTFGANFITSHISGVTALVENTYEMIKKNIDSIFGNYFN